MELATRQSFELKASEITCLKQVLSHKDENFHLPSTFIDTEGHMHTYIFAYTHGLHKHLHKHISTYMHSHITWPSQPHMHTHKYIKEFCISKSE